MRCRPSVARSVKVYRGHTSERFCAFAAFGVHDGTVLCGGEDRGIRLWDLNTRTVRQLLPGRPSADAPGDGHCDTVVALDVHPTRRLLASGALDADRTIKLWTDEPPGAAEEAGAEEAQPTAADKAPQQQAPAPPGEPEEQANGSAHEQQEPMAEG